MEQLYCSGALITLQQPSVMFAKTVYRAQGKPRGGYDEAVKALWREEQALLRVHGARGQGCPYVVEYYGSIRPRYDINAYGQLLLGPWGPERMYELCRDRCLTLPALQKAQLVQQLLEAVRYMHQMGVAHGDLSDNNVLVSRVGGTWQLKLCDFGCARVLLSPIGSVINSKQVHNDSVQCYKYDKAAWQRMNEQRKRHRQAERQHKQKPELQGIMYRRYTDSSELGTLHYMPPERLRRRPLDYPCDVWSAMCLAGQLLTGQIPYASLEKAGIGLSDTALLEAMAEDVLPISADALARLLPQCRELLLAGLEMKPAKRATAAQLLEMMPAWLAAL